MVFTVYQNPLIIILYYTKSESECISICACKMLFCFDSIFRHSQRCLCSSSEKKCGADCIVHFMVSKNIVCQHLMGMN